MIFFFFAVLNCMRLFVWSDLMNDYIQSGNMNLLYHLLNLVSRTVAEISVLAAVIKDQGQYSDVETWFSPVFLFHQFICCFFLVFSTDTQSLIHKE